MIKKISLSILLLSLTACQAVMYGTGRDFDELRIGMTKEQVIEKLGQPVSVGATTEADIENLYYRKMAKALDWSTTSYLLVFKKGKLIKYGETAN